MIYRDRVKFATSTTGTGAVTVGAASSGFMTPAAAGIPDQESFPYVIEDGSAWETGTATYTVAGTSVARSMESSSTGALISLSGTATMFCAPNSTKLGRLPPRGKMIALSIGMNSN